MSLLIPTFALWHEMADCTGAMAFWQNEATAPTSWAYQYDGDGHLRWAEMKDGTGFTNLTMLFAYDADGELAETRFNPRADGSGGRAIRLSRTPWGDLLSEQDDRDDGIVEARTWDWHVDQTRIGSAQDIDGDGRADSWSEVWNDDSAFRNATFEEFVTASRDAVARFTYDSLGRLIETRTDDGELERTVWRGYDEAGRILWKNADNDGDGTADTQAIWNWWCPAGPPVLRQGR